MQYYKKNDKGGKSISDKDLSIILSEERNEVLTSAAEKKESSEVMVVASSSRSLCELSTVGRIRVPSLSAKGTA